MMPAGRVQVGVRCRPIFESEMSENDVPLFVEQNIVETRMEVPNDKALGTVTVSIAPGKKRDFYFDVVLGPHCAQDEVYNRVGKPVISQVMAGYNGSIFAYGQTGSGKTHSMGILHLVRDENAGIVPRAVSEIFERIDKLRQDDAETVDISVSMSFLQLYNETIQDLLVMETDRGDSKDSRAPAADRNVNLAIREDPLTGFYVEGLQEFSISSYHEAEALINLGLENRAIAPTLMNATSSRSHTVLTIHIQQQQQQQRPLSRQDVERGGGGDTAWVSSHMHSKLTLVDLAGSERIRRTVSEGARLTEARTINRSLSVLGNVVSALADPAATHIPYRDSKLTRLLQDSLGGSAYTFLLATVSPSATDVAETLSTLAFATRCMAVKTAPVRREQMDWVSVCARLQDRVRELETDGEERLFKQRVRYENMIHDMHAKLTKANAHADSSSNTDKSALDVLLSHLGSIRALPSDALSSVPAWLATAARGGDHVASLGIVEGGGRERGEGVGKVGGGIDTGTGSAELLVLLGFCYSALEAIAHDSVGICREVRQREATHAAELAALFVAEENEKEGRADEGAAVATEVAHMEREDDCNIFVPPAGSLHGEKVSRREAVMTSREAVRAVEVRHGSLLRSVEDIAAISEADMNVKMFTKCDSVEDVAGALAALFARIDKVMLRISEVLREKDVQYQSIKLDLAAELVEKARRAEEATNWSFILKYLVSSNQQMRRQLQTLQRQLPQRHSGPSNTSPGGRDGVGHTNPSILSAEFGAVVGSKRDGIDQAVAARVPGKAPPEGGLKGGDGIYGDDDNSTGGFVGVDDALVQEIAAGASAVKKASGLYGPPVVTPTAVLDTLNRPRRDDNSHNTSQLRGRRLTSSTGASDDGDGDYSSEAFAKRSVAASDCIFSEKSIHSGVGLVPVSLTRSRRAAIATASASTFSKFLHPPSSSLGSDKSRELPHSAFVPLPASRQRSISGAPSSRTATCADDGVDGAWARKVAADLLVDESEVDDAAVLVERVSRMSRAQLNALDPQTREEILEIRRHLGIPIEQPLVAVGSGFRVRGRGSGRSRSRSPSVLICRSSADGMRTPIGAVPFPSSAIKRQSRASLELTHIQPHNSSSRGSSRERGAGDRSAGRRPIPTISSSVPGSSSSGDTVLTLDQWRQQQRAASTQPPAHSASSLQSRYQTTAAVPAPLAFDTHRNTEGGGQSIDQPPTNHAFDDDEEFSHIDNMDDYF